MPYKILPPSALRVQFINKVKPDFIYNGVGYHVMSEALYEASNEQTVSNYTAFNHVGNISFIKYKHGGKITKIGIRRIKKYLKYRCMI